MRESPNIPSRAQSVIPAAEPRKRGARLTDRIMPVAVEEKPSSFTQRVLFPFLERFTQPGGWLMSNLNQDDIRVRLLRAGFPYGLRAQTFVAVKIIAAIVGALLLLIYFPILRDLFAGYGRIPWFWSPVFIAVGALYGFRMPDIWLAIQIRKRQNAIQLALPDMMDLISISVEAGLGLMAAIQRISERFSNPLSEEFLRTLQEIRLGRAQADALRDMTRRVDVDDLTTLLTAIVQAELLGLAVSNVLRIQSERLRERRAQRAREAAQKAPIKMTFPLVLFIFPALFIVVLGPALISIFLQQGAF